MRPELRLEIGERRRRNPARLHAVGRQLGRRAVEAGLLFGGGCDFERAQPFELDRPAGAGNHALDEPRVEVQGATAQRPQHRRSVALEVGRQHASRGLRGPGARRPRVEDAHRGPGLRQLERHRAADDPGADDDHIWLAPAARTHCISGYAASGLADYGRNSAQSRSPRITRVQRRASAADPLNRLSRVASRDESSRVPVAGSRFPPRKHQNGDRRADLEPAGRRAEVAVPKYGDGRLPTKALRFVRVEQVERLHVEVEPVARVAAVHHHHLRAAAAAATGPPPGPRCIAAPWRGRRGRADRHTSGRRRAGRRD